MKTSIISLGLFSHTGGPVKTVRDFRRALDADLYAFCERNTLKKHPLSIEGARPVVSSQWPLLSQFCYTREGTKEVETAVRDSKIVSCHSFYRYHALFTHKTCKAAGVPYSFVPHGILDPWVIQKNRWAKQLYLKMGGQRFLQDAAVTIFSTQTEKDKAASQFELSESVVIPWAVELVELTNYEETRVLVRKQLNIPLDAHTLLYFGRLHSIKRPLETIKAIASDSARIHLVIVGNEDGVTKKDCMQLARRLGIEKRIHFIGPVYAEKKYQYMHAADAYISLSFKENFNYTAAESLAAGLPVILSSGNDLRSDLSGVGCCLEIEDHSLQSAVKSIKEFTNLSLPKLREMGLLGRKWVEENLNFDLFKTRLLKLHTQLLCTESA
jgi:glycosyltransferase involved in cell wall biosynthesis